MTQTKRNYVFKAFDEGLICVFPTEVTARSYLTDYALHGEKHAILSSQAISYDTFRQYFLPTHEELLPSSNLVRQVFIHQLMEKGMSLTYFLNPSFPEMNSRAQGYLANLLPSLSIACESELLNQLDAGMQHDIVLLFQKYTEFLAEHKMFEPRYEVPSQPVDWDQSKHYCILFSDTIPDASVLYTLLGNPDYVQLRETPTDDGVPLEVFSSHIEEVKTTMRRIRQLLDQGVQTHQIVIGTGAQSVMMPALREEASLYGIPLSIREGKSALEYSSGRFLSLLQALYTEQFSLETMKSLLLDPSIPWADPALHRELLREAVDQSIIRGSLYGSDQYKSMLKNPKLKDWYEHFKQSVIGILQSTDIEGLQKTLNHFQDTYFVESQWVGTPGEDVYAFCLGAMQQIKDSMKQCSMDSYPSIFSFLLSYLQNKRYVPQQKEEGIAVYGWPQVSTLQTDFLFAIALDQDSAACIDKPLAFLPQQIEQRYRREVDPTEAQFKAVSLGDGVRHLSCHTRRYEGEMIPPAYFLQRKPLIYPNREELSFIDDPLHIEGQLFVDGSKPTGQATSSQKRWFLQAEKTVLKEKDEDYTRYPTNKHLLGMLLDEQGRLKISPTKLDLFVRCPYAWLCHYLYGIEKQEFEVSSVDHRKIGNLIHAIFYTFFWEAKDFDPAKLDEYRPRMRQIFDEKLVFFYGETGPSPSLRSWLVSEFREKLVALLDAEAILFAHGRSIALEEVYQIEENGLLLNGKVDRLVSMDPPTHSKLAIIDYKKGIPKDKKMKDTLISYQLPLYRFILSQSLGAEITNASYYSVKDEKYYSLWKDADDENAQKSDQLLQEKLKEIAEAVKEGRFMATPSKEHCANCDYRSLCRRRYATP